MDYPFVTIIMPVRNEAAYIERSLRSVLNQDYPTSRIEVIIADGMSSDSTRHVVQQFQSEFPGVHLVDNPGLIAPTGLNTALRLAKGDIIIRVDGHCEVAPDYVRRCVEHLSSENAEGVGGPIVSRGETYMARVIAAAMSHPFGVGDSAFRTHIPPMRNEDRSKRGDGGRVDGEWAGASPAPTMRLVDSVPFPAYTREIIRRAGPYDEEMVRNQDDEYNYRLRKLGACILLAGDIQSRYYSRSTLRSLWNQFFGYGFWKVRVLQKHPRQMRLRQFVPPFFAFCLVSLLVTSTWSHYSKIFLILYLGVYLAANTAASLWVSSKSNWRNLPVLPLVFAILHLSYGLGFLTGLVRFARRWGDRSTPEW
jgi:succinoglycan biosynthesis protein ExoA